MKKIAIPLENGRLCAHFGHCQQFAIIEVVNESIAAETYITPPPHEPGLLPGWLAEKVLTHIIAGGMGQRSLHLFKEQNIQVCVGAPSDTPASLVQQWIKGSLTTGSNTCDH